MKHDIVPAWMWQPPGEIIEGLIARSARQRLQLVPRETKRGVAVGGISDEGPAEPSVTRDRYHTMARRARVVSLEAVIKENMKRRGNAE